MIFFPFAKILQAATAFRNLLYDRNIFKKHRLGAYTVSVGNITAGGTGKTPLVEYIAGLLAAEGEKVAILTRGYGRREKGRIVVSDGQAVMANAETGGDEPLELARKLIGRAVVIADPDRVGAAKFAIDRFGITAFVLDDGFQHRRAERDIDVVCIDATDPFGGGDLLPAGRLRESLNGLKRANAIVITRGDLVEDVSRIKEELTPWLQNGVPIFTAGLLLLGYVRAGSEAEPGPLPSKPAFLFSAIGNPQSFEVQQRRAGVDVRGAKAFRDHHYYTQDDLARIEQMARAAGAEILVTTAKDAVKLADLQIATPLFVALTELEVTAAARFAELIKR